MVTVHVESSPFSFPLDISFYDTPVRVVILLNYLILLLIIWYFLHPFFIYTNKKLIEKTNFIAGNPINSPDDDIIKYRTKKPQTDFLILNKTVKEFKLRFLEKIWSNNFFKKLGIITLFFTVFLTFFFNFFFFWSFYLLKNTRF